MHRMIRLYFDELGSEFVEAVVSERAFEALKKAEKINVDDGGVWFAELLLDYPHKEIEING